MKEKENKRITKMKEIHKLNRKEIALHLFNEYKQNKTVIKETLT